MSDTTNLKWMREQKPFPDHPLRNNDGQTVWHGVTPYRAAYRLPDGAKGPIRARPQQAEKREYDRKRLDQHDRNVN